MSRSRSAVLFLFVLLFTSQAFAQHAVRPDTSGTNVNADQVKQLLAEKPKPVVIDVRSVQEYRYGHIPGAIHIPSVLIKARPDLLPKNKSTLIIMYARGDSFTDIDRGFNAAYKLGYKNLRRFSGGMIEWLDKHYPVKKGAKP